MDIHPVIHVSRLKPAQSSSTFPDRPAARRLPPTALVAWDPDLQWDPRARFHPHSIVDVRINPDHGRWLDFKVHWDHPWSDPRWDSWEPYHELKHLRLLRAYLYSPAYYRFKATEQFQQWAQQHRRAVPRLAPVHE